MGEIVKEEREEQTGRDRRERQKGKKREKGKRKCQ